jgi:hypothetical protein
MSYSRGVHCAALLVLFSASFLAAADNENSRRSLTGLRGVRVIVEISRHPELDAVGLTVTAVRTDAELRLRKAGIRVLEADQVPGSPYLYLNATVTTAGKESWGDSILVSLRQTVILDRDPSIRIDAETWSVLFGGGIHAPTHDYARYMRDGFNDGIDQFINAYLAANPK